MYDTEHVIVGYERTPTVDWANGGYERTPVVDWAIGSSASAVVSSENGSLNKYVKQEKLETHMELNVRW